MTHTAAETRSPHFGREATANTYRDVHLPRIFTPWARVLLDVVRVRPGEAVLDVATGPGSVARPAAALAGPGGRVVGVDISPAMLAVGRAWPPEAGAAPIEYLESSATSLPVPDAAFDVAFCQQGLQHMSDPLTALREMRRALRPAGRLGIALWVRSPFELFREVVADLGLAGDGPQPSQIGRDAEALAAVLREAGFSDVNVQQRELLSVLEGGVPQALEVAAASSATAAMTEGSADQKAVIARAITSALEPYIHADGVHLTSVANIASAHV